MSCFVRPAVQISNIFSLQRYNKRYKKKKSWRRECQLSKLRLRLISRVIVTSINWTSSNRFFSPKLRDKEKQQILVLKKFNICLKIRQKRSIDCRFCRFWSLAAALIETDCKPKFLEANKDVVHYIMRLFPSSIDYISSGELLPNQNIIPARIVVCWTCWRTLWTIPLYRTSMFTYRLSSNTHVSFL